MERILLLDREIAISLKSYAHRCCRKECDTQKILKNILAYSVQTKEKAKSYQKDMPQVVIDIAVTYTAPEGGKHMYIIGSTMERICNIKVKITVA